MSEFSLKFKKVTLEALSSLFISLCTFPCADFPRRLGGLGRRTMPSASKEAALRGSSPTSSWELKGLDCLGPGFTKWCARERRNRRQSDLVTFAFPGKMSNWYNDQALKAASKFEISLWCYFNLLYAFLLLKAVKFLRNTQSHFLAQRGRRREETMTLFSGQKGEEISAGECGAMLEDS